MNALAILSASAAALALTPTPATVIDEVSAEVDVQVEAEAAAQADTQIQADIAAQTEEEAVAAVEERVAARIVDLRAEADAVAAAQATGEMPVQLVSWDGDFELMKASRRMRIWRSHIAYNLSVDAEGKATGCELTETFRMRRISDTLCEVLIAHHTFEPANDASGTPIAGEYSARIAYADVYERLN
jgi:hypothetical protein